MINQEINFLLDVPDEYADGKMNLKEAIRRIQFVLSLPEKPLEKLFKDKEIIDVLLHYEKGKINLKQTINRLENLSGLSHEVTETFVRSLNRNNVIQLREKQRTQKTIYIKI